MPRDATSRTDAWRRASAAAGCCAVMIAFAVSMFVGTTHTTVFDAHRKLVVVVTVTTRPPASPEPLVASLRATPEIRAPRTMIVKPFSP